MKLEDGFSKTGESMKTTTCWEYADQPRKIRGEVEVLIWKGPPGKDLHDKRFLGAIDLGENLIVTLARRIMSRIIVGAAPAPGPVNPTIAVDTPGHPSYPAATITNVNQIFITKMCWGTGGHNPLNPTEPIDPLPTDENLYNPIPDPAYKPVIVDYPDVATVRCTATLEQDEANGIGLSEVGLFTAQHTLLFGRKTFGVLTKSSEFSFTFRYSVIF